ncbi:MAG: aminotransferase class IV [Rikenellaceae bacterium]
MQLPYLYQTIHTHHLRALHLAEHCEILERYYWQLQFRRITLSRDQIADQIEELLRKSEVLEQLSTHVELRLYLDGQTSLKIAEQSIYEGYTLRCFNPFVTIQSYDNPLGDYPTSARRTAAELAHHQSALEGADASIRCGTDDVVYSCYDSPLFCVKGNRLFASPQMASVERSLAIYAIQRCKYEFTELPITRDQLPKFDELFWVDAYGITAIAQYGNRRYMAVIAEKISKQMR